MVERPAEWGLGVIQDTNAGKEAAMRSAMRSGTFQNIWGDNTAKMFRFLLENSPHPLSFP